jgi:hypothetical protein
MASDMSAQNLLHVERTCCVAVELSSSSIMPTELARPNPLGRLKLHVHTIHATTAVVDHTSGLLLM